MSDTNITDMGFTLSWSFHDADDSRYEEYINNPLVCENVLADLASVLSICARYELFFPLNIMNDEGDIITFSSQVQHLVIDQIREMFASGEISHEVTQIGGYGFVYLPDGTKERIDNLIGIGPVRLFERQLTVYTSKSVWVPIRIDHSYEFTWQIQLAELNAGRLETCLHEIFLELGIPVSPGLYEIDKENPVWQSGFRLFVNPEILMREYKSAPPTETFILSKYLAKYDNNET